MATTYLSLVNKVCRQLNEVELTSANFSTAKGVYNTAKDAVNFAINKINAQNFEWPFNYVNGQEKALVVGTSFYSFESDYKIVDWDSFYIKKTTTPSTETIRLRWINKDEFFYLYRDKDLDNTTDGLERPIFVFPWGNEQFGVTPVPDAAYTVIYNYWKNFTDLSAHGDTVSIPDEFTYVIILGALWYMHIFKEDSEATQMVEQNFTKEINNMRKILINKPENVYSPRRMSYVRWYGTT